MKAAAHPSAVLLRLGMLALFLALSGLLPGGSAQAAPNFPALSGRVVDKADLLTPEQEAAISAKLAEHEKKTTNQLVVVTLPSLQGYEIRDFGYQLGRHWKIGQKDKNNGVLLIVAPKERKVAIEVGYGLEGTLTDALSKIIIEQSITPRFRKKDMAGGIMAGVDDILKVLGGGGQSLMSRAAKARDKPKTTLEAIIPIVVLIFNLLIFAIVAYSIVRSATGKGGKGGRKSWHWSSGGSSGGGWSGGGGGFSGGGGSFGGGGSSGGW